MSFILEVKECSDTFSDIRTHIFAEGLQEGQNRTYLFALYTLELLKTIRKDNISPAHAYLYTVLTYGVSKTDDVRKWNEYLNKYRKEIELDLSFRIIQTISDLGNGILSAPKALCTSGLPKDIYEFAKNITPSLNGYVLDNCYSTIELSFRQLDVTENEKAARSLMFILDELHNKFRLFLKDCTRPISSTSDLENRTSIHAIRYYTTILSIIYRLFSKLDRSYNLVFDHIYLNNSNHNHIKTKVNTVPIREAEAILRWTGKESVGQQSVVKPMSLDSTVDRYLTLLFDTCR